MLSDKMRDVSGPWEEDFDILYLSAGAARRVDNDATLQL